MTISGYSDSLEWVISMGIHIKKWLEMAYSGNNSVSSYNYGIKWLRFKSKVVIFESDMLFL